MTRREAVALVDHAINEVHRNGAHGRTHDLVAALAALGVLKLEQPQPLSQLHLVACNGIGIEGVPLEWCGGPNSTALIREDTMIEALRSVGYEVTKRNMSTEA